MHLKFPQTNGKAKFSDAKLCARLYWYLNFLFFVSHSFCNLKSLVISMNRALPAGPVFLHCGVSYYLTNMDVSVQ